MTGFPLSRPLKKSPLLTWREARRAIGAHRLAARHYALLAILGLYLLLALGYRTVVPPTLAPDEQGHVQFVKDLVYRGELPVYSYPRSAEAHQPPLYYLTAVPVVEIFPIPGFVAHVATGPDEARGYRRLRLVSIAYGLVTVLLFYRLARVAFPDRPRLGPLAAAFGGLLPQFTFLTSTVNNDNAATAFGVLLAIGLVGMARAPTITPRQAAFFGVTLGLATVSKESMLTFFPIGAAVIALKGREWRAQIRLIAIAGGLVAVCVLPYAIRNHALYGSWLTSTTPTFHIPTNVAAPPEWRNGTFPSRWFLTTFPKGVFTSFWGALSWTNLRLSPFYPIFLGLSAVSLAGLALAARDLRRRGADWRRDPDLAALAVLVVVATVFCLGIISYNTRAHSPQGRHIFPALGALVVLGSLGIDALARRGRRVRPWVWPAAVALILVAANFSGIVLYATGAGRLDPVTPVPIDTVAPEARLITSRPSETLLPATRVRFETKEGDAGIWRWKVDPPAPWLRVRADRTGDRDLDLILSADPADLPVGVHSTQLTVEGDGMAVQGRSLPVRLEIVERQILLPIALAAAGAPIEPKEALTPIEPEGPDAGG